MQQYRDSTDDTGKQTALKSIQELMGAKTPPKQDTGISPFEVLIGDKYTSEQKRIARETIRSQRSNAGSFVAMFDPSNPGIISKFFNPKSGAVVEPPGSFMKNPPTTAAMEKTALLQSMREDVALAKELFGKTKSEIGPASGRWGRIKAATIGASPDFTDLLQITENLADQLLRARSGAQINEKEFERLRALMPNVNDPVQTFERRLAQFERELANVIGKRSEAGISTPGSGKKRTFTLSTGKTVTLE